jgi:hypothetical protein
MTRTKGTYCECCGAVADQPHHDKDYKGLIVAIKLSEKRGKYECQPCLEGGDLHGLQQLVDKAREARSDLDTALRAIEDYIGEGDIDGLDDIIDTCDAESVMELVKEQNEGGEPDEDDDDEPGPCLTCGTQCDSEGICPLCAVLEVTEEHVREATAVSVQAGLRGKVPAQVQKALRDAYAARDKAKAQPVDSCRKCGAMLTLGDIVDGAACVDEGEDEEEGNVFVYCSEHCRETH